MPRAPGYTSYSAALDGSEMTRDELEFLFAIAGFQKQFGRRYPTWREVLHVAHCLGYRKVADTVPIGRPQPPETESTRTPMTSSKTEED
jgi:hypothetical protein